MNDCARIAGASVPLTLIKGPLDTKIYLNLFGDHAQSSIRLLFSEEDGCFQLNNTLQHSTRIIKMWFREHDSAFILRRWTRHSPDLNLTGETDSSSPIRQLIRVNCETLYYLRRMVSPRNTFKDFLCHY